MLVDSAGKVQCQGGGNCGFYSILKLQANEVSRSEHKFPTAIIRRFQDSKQPFNGIIQTNVQRRHSNKRSTVSFKPTFNGIIHMV